MKQFFIESIGSDFYRAAGAAAVSPRFSVGKMGATASQPRRGGGNSQIVFKNIVHATALPHREVLSCRR